MQGVQPHKHQVTGGRGGPLVGAGVELGRHPVRGTGNGDPCGRPWGSTLPGGQVMWQRFPLGDKPAPNADSLPSPLTLS